MDRRAFVGSVGASATVLVASDLEALLRSLSQPGMEAPAMSDYVLSAGFTGVLLDAVDLLKAKPNTCVVPLNDPDVVSFIEFLTTALPDRSALVCNLLSGAPVAPPLPAGVLYIVSHASNEGVLFTRLGPTGHHFATYSDVQDVIDRNLIVIPDRLVSDQRPTGAPAPLVRILGCRIGASRRFMEGLWTAFNNLNVELVAPKHFDFFYGGGKGVYLTGMMEYLAYSFELTSACRLQDRDAIITAFDSDAKRIFASLSNAADPDDHPAHRAWRHFEGADISKTLWEAWIPNDAAIPMPLNKHRRIPHTVTFANAVEGNPDIYHNFGEYRHEIRRYRFVFPNGGTHAQKDTLGRRAAVSAFLQGGLDFQPGYSGGPVWEWYGFGSYGEFIDGFSWGVADTDPCVPSPTVGNKDKTQWWGVRHVYTCLVPIRDNNGNLIFNYTGGSLSEHQFGLDALLDDKFLFRKVTGP